MFKSKIKKYLKWKASDRKASEPQPNKCLPDNLVSQLSLSLIKPRVRVTIKPPKLELLTEDSQKPVNRGREEKRSGRKPRTALKSDVQHPNNVRNTTTSPFNMLSPTDKDKNASYHAPVSYHPSLHLPPLHNDPPHPPPLPSEKQGEPGQLGEPAAAKTKVEISERAVVKEVEKEGIRDEKACDYLDCPAVKNVQEENLFRTDDCPAVLRKKIVKETNCKRATRKAGSSKKNPLAFLGFADKDCRPKRTKERKKCTKKVRCIDEANEDPVGRCRSKPKQFTNEHCQTECSELQSKPQTKPEPNCKSKPERKDHAPIDRSHQVKATKVTVCSIAGCPASKKKKLKNCIDRGQSCTVCSEVCDKPEMFNIQRVEIPEACPRDPCQLKDKFERYFSNCVSSAIEQRYPVFEMTCEETHSSLQPQASKLRNKQPLNCDKNINIVAHFDVPAPIDEPFLTLAKDAQAFPLKAFGKPEHTTMEE